MHFSQLFGKTLREAPSEAQLSSHQLLVRGGFVRGWQDGLFAYLPLGQAALQRLEARVQNRLAALGGQPLVVPAVYERDSAKMLLDLARREIDSYRQLPMVLYQIMDQKRANPSLRSGLLGAGEQRALDVNVFGSAELAANQSEVQGLIDGLFASCEVPVVWAEAGKARSAAFYGHPAGDHEVAQCTQCTYAAERSWATRRWEALPPEEELAVEEVATPGCNTIAALVEFLHIPASKTLKMVFCSVEGKVTCVAIRGDRTIDEAKLARALGTDRWYASLEQELEAVGAVGGYASPIGLDRKRVRVLGDPSLHVGSNFVSGANRPDTHLLNVNVPRDFEPDEWIDLARVEPGDPCPNCGGELEIQAAFSLAHHLAPQPCAPEIPVLDAEGRGQPLWWARWSVDLGGLLAAVVECHHDDHGILWPIACSPFDVHLVVLDGRKEPVAAQAESLLRDLCDRGLTVLYDDRDASAGVKFNDADLIGIPLRLTVSKRSAQEGVIEAKWRTQSDRMKLDPEGLDRELAHLCGD